jgi:hypothetical protein
VLLNLLASRAFARQDAPPGTRRRIWLVVDEFQTFPGADFAFMLSELAKYGVQLVLGTQSLKLLEQANPKTRAAWLANTSTLFVFRASAEDALILEGELGVSTPDALSATASDIVGLTDYTCYVRVQDDRRTPQVFCVDTRKADDGDDAVLQRVLARSRATYGVDAAEVDAWLARASELQGEPTLGLDGAHAFQTPKPVPMPQNGISLAGRTRAEQIAAVNAERAAERRA